MAKHTNHYCNGVYRYWQTTYMISMQTNMQYHLYLWLVQWSSKLRSVIPHKRSFTIRSKWSRLWSDVCVLWGLHRRLYQAIDLHTSNAFVEIYQTDLLFILSINKKNEGSVIPVYTREAPPKTVTLSRVYTGPASQGLRIIGIPHPPTGTRETPEQVEERLKK